MQVFFMIPLKIVSVSTCTQFWIKNTQIVPVDWKNPMQTISYRKEY